MIYTNGNIPQQHIAKEYYTHHNNMLEHNGLAAVIYDLHYIHQGAQRYCQNMKISTASGTRTN